MACLYKRGRIYWISYYIDDKQFKKSLNTTNERVARNKLKKIEYDLALGDLHVASKLPLPSILEAFCSELMATRTYKSYKNDLSRLRVFFGPICDALKPGVPGIMRSQGNTDYNVDKYAGKHVRAEFLEDITTSKINRFITARVEQDGWSAKTANLMRQTLHKLFNYAIMHHDFRSRDRRYPNPAAGVERRKESAPQIRFLELDEIEQQLEILSNYPILRLMVGNKKKSCFRFMRPLQSFHISANYCHEFIL
jgi:integrase